MTSVRSLEDLLPIYRIEQDCLIARNGAVSVVFELELPEVFSLSAQDYEAFHQLWLKILNLLPAPAIFHKQDWFVTRKVQGAFAEKEAFLDQSSERHFHERPYAEHRCFVILCLPTQRNRGHYGSSSLLKPRMLAREVLRPEGLEGFLEAASRIQALMEASPYLKAHRLDADALAGTPEARGLLERYVSLDAEAEALADLQLRPELAFSGRPCVCFSLSDPSQLPALLGVKRQVGDPLPDGSALCLGFAHPLGERLSGDHIYNQILIREETASTMKRLERRRLRLQALSARSRENALARDATQHFLEEALQESRCLVRAHFHVLAASEPGEQRALRSRLASAFSAMDLVPRQETDTQALLWWGCFPGNEAEFPLEETFDCFAEQASCLFHMESHSRSSLSPIGLRLGDRLSGRPLHVDLSDEPLKKGLIANRNKFILGPSGSGKSFFTNHMVRSAYEQGSHIVLVDLGGSYEGLCRLLGGRHISYTDQAPLRFNPFRLPRAGAVDLDKKESLKALLFSLWKKEHEENRRSEYVSLSAALDGYYRNLGEEGAAQASFNGFYAYAASAFRAWLAREGVRREDFDLDNFLYVLRPFYQDGEFQDLLNATEPMDLLQERLIVFELDSIRDHPILLPAVTLMIMEVCMAKMRRLKGIRKIILIEEAWKAIAREGMAEYVKYLFKTVRKSFGEAIVVTQELEDILESDHIRQAILNNADCKILLDQSKYRQQFGRIQQWLGLSEQEKVQVLSLNQHPDGHHRYKEVFISLGGRHCRVYRTEVSPEEYYTYTTEEREKLLVQERCSAYGGNMQAALRSLVLEHADSNPKAS